MTLSAESDGVVECALDLGRKVELFVASDGDAHEDVARRVGSAWEGVWREGKFGVSPAAPFFIYTVDDLFFSLSQPGICIGFCEVVFQRVSTIPQTCCGTFSTWKLVSRPSTPGGVGGGGGLSSFLCSISMTNNSFYRSEQSCDELLYVLSYVDTVVEVVAVRLALSSFLHVVF